MRPSFGPGDWVIYRKSKRSTTPGRRARLVMASMKGEKYSYVVDKFWIVEAVLPGNKLLLKTRRGKVHQISGDDLNLRRANLWYRIMYRHRFIEASQTGDVAGGAAGAV
jgi:hypothetical protein